MLLRSSVCVVLLAAGTAPLARAEKLSYHEVKTDAAGHILPWYGGGPSQAYDHVVRLVWDFWKNMRPCPNGVPYYLQHQVWKPDQDDSRGLGGDQIPMALSSWNLLYGYLGDESIQQNMSSMADLLAGNRVCRDRRCAGPTYLILTTLNYTPGGTTETCVPEKAFCNRTRRPASRPSSSCCSR